LGSFESAKFIGYTYAEGLGLDYFDSVFITFKAELSSSFSNRYLIG